MPQRHVTGRFVEICPKAAVPDPGTPGQQIGKDLDHQVLCLVNIIEFCEFLSVSFVWKDNGYLFWYIIGESSCIFNRMQGGILPSLTFSHSYANLFYRLNDQ